LAALIPPSPPPARRHRLPSGVGTTDRLWWLLQATRDRPPLKGRSSNDPVLSQARAEIPRTAAASPPLKFPKVSPPWFPSRSRARCRLILVTCNSTATGLSKNCRSGLPDHALLPTNHDQESPISWFACWPGVDAPGDTLVPRAATLTQTDHGLKGRVRAVSPTSFQVRGCVFFSL
jgi:hypothetical protein